MLFVCCLKWLVSFHSLDNGALFFLYGAKKNSNAIIKRRSFFVCGAKGDAIIIRRLLFFCFVAVDLYIIKTNKFTQSYSFLIKNEN